MQGRLTGSFATQYNDTFNRLIEVEAVAYKVTPFLLTDSEVLQTSGSSLNGEEEEENECPTFFRKYSESNGSTSKSPLIRGFFPA